MKAVRRIRIVFTALLIVLASWGFDAYQRYLHAPLRINQAQDLNVARGSTFGQVVRELAARGVLQHPLLLQLYARVSGRGHRIQAGDYLLGPGASPLELLDMLEEGHVREHSITLIEGWTLAQARAQLAKDSYLKTSLAGVSNTDLLAALSIDAKPGRNPEGLFFPDTYVFSGATSDRDILRQAYRRMQKVLAEEWQQRADNLPYQNSTLR